MPKKGSFKPKDKYAALPKEFQDAIAQSSTDEIRKRVSDIAILDVKEREILKQDPEVQLAKEQLKNLMEPYRENLKSYKLQIEFCNRVLDDKGGGASISRDSFKKQVGDMLEKAVGAENLQRDVSFSK